MTESRSLTMLIHGPTKVGKSTLAVTAPYPRLYLDVESASRFLPINRKVWNPYTEDIPLPDGTWDTAIVYCRDYDTVVKVLQRIETENHQFASLIIDSISELQIRLKEDISAGGPMERQHWGALLDEFTARLRDFRDLTMHPTNPLQTVILTAMTQVDEGFSRPYLQGSSRDQVGYLYDVIGYLFESQELDENNNPVQVRKLLTRKHLEFEAGERVQGRLDQFERNPNIVEMIDKIFPPPPALPTVEEPTLEKEEV